MDRFLAFLNRKRRAKFSQRWQIMSDYSVSYGTETTAGRVRILELRVRAEGQL